MAITAWKRIEKSPGYPRARTSLKRLVGKELRLPIELGVKTEKDGGWRFAPSELAENSVVYSLGVGEDIEFDLSVIDRYNVGLHAFDPTPSSITMLAETGLPDRFEFHPWAITAEDGALKFYPRVRKDDSKSAVMDTMIPEDASTDDAIEVPAFSLRR